MSETSQDPKDQLTESDQHLRYLGVLEYEGHTIKLARRGNIIKALIYVPDELLASHIIEASIDNYKDAVRDAMEMVDRLIAEPSQTAR
jgi:hypothetical protein